MAVHHTTLREKSENATIIGHFGLVCEENSSSEIVLYS